MSYRFGSEPAQPETGRKFLTLATLTALAVTIASAFVYAFGSLPGAAPANGNPFELSSANSSPIAITSGAAASASPPGAFSGAPLSVRVVGNHLVNQNGQTVRLIGFTRDESQWACTAPGSPGVWNGPASVESQTGVSQMLAWHIDAVRIPLNEDCWLGINGYPTGFSSTAYQTAIVNYVDLLRANGIYSIVELHLNAPGTVPSNQQQDMVDQDHGPAFWSSVASTFKSNPAVLFDLYNEPMGLLPGMNPANTSLASIWSCWLNGCSVNTLFVQPRQTPTTYTWQTAGMQELVDVVRSAGAGNPIMIGGIRYANDLSQWLQYLPRDPDNALVASAHVYPFNYCATATCIVSTLGTIARTHPVVIGETGEADCADSFVNTVMSIADTYGISYLAWSYDVRPSGASCSAINNAGAALTLLSDWSGTPDSYGAGVKVHFQGVSFTG